MDFILEISSFWLFWYCFSFFLDFDSYCYEYFFIISNPSNALFEMDFSFINYLFDFASICFILEVVSLRVSSKDKILVFSSAINSSFCINHNCNFFISSFNPPIDCYAFVSYNLWCCWVTFLLLHYISNISFSLATSTLHCWCFFYKCWQWLESCYLSISRLIMVF